MAETQKVGRPNDGEQDEWQHDLNPNLNAGVNDGMAGALPEKEGTNAYEIKELHSVLKDYSSDELKQIVVLLHGSRLKQGAKYIDLMDSQREEFTAMGNESAEPGHWYVPKTEIDYVLWNRLRGVEDSDRLDEPST